MKTLLILTLLSSLSLGVVAQDFSKLDQIRLDKAEDYAKVEDQVRACADYLLTTAVDKKNANRQHAGKFITRWMIGSPDYTFELGSQMMDLVGKDTDMMQVYFAALIKTALSGKEGDALYEKTETLFLDYCAKPDNKAKKTKTVKKALKKR